MRFRKVSLTMDKDFDGITESPVLIIYGRGEDGKKYRHPIRGLRSYFYVGEDPHKKLSATEQSRVRNIRSGFNSIYGEPLWEIETQMPSDTIELRKPFKKHYEADIHWVERAAIDLKLTDGYTFDAEGELLPVADVSAIKLRTWVVDIEVITDPKIFATPEDPIYPIACIVVWDSYTQQQYVFESKTVSESVMLEKFYEFIKEQDPDIITGWNISFDMGYLITRTMRFNDLKKPPKWERKKGFYTAPQISKYGKATARNWSFQRGLIQWAFEVDGYQVFDGLAAYKVKKNPSGRQASYNLHAVAKNELEIEWEDYGNRIQSQWEKDYKVIIDYCKKDVEVETKIITKESLVDQALAIAALSGCTLSQTTSKEQIIDHAILLRRGNRILPSKPKRKKDEDGTPIEDNRKVKGGLVLTPPAGVHQYVGVFDAAALYPSIIAGFNISAETKNPDGAITITDEINNIYHFRRADLQKGIMPETITEFRALRESVRAEKREAEKTFGHDSKEYKALEELDTADKFIITSFYGVMGFAGFRLFDPDCANAITAVWRVLAAGLVNYLKHRGFEVIYGDTDSMFIKIGTIENGYKVKDYIHEYLHTELAKMGVTGTEIEVKFEKFFDKIAFKMKKQGGVAKKRYVGIMTWSEGQPTKTIYVRGFETRRSDTSSFLKKTMDKFFEMWLKDDNESGALEYLKELKKNFNTLPAYDIAIPRQSKNEETHSVSRKYRKHPTTGERIVVSEKDITTVSPWVRGVKYGRDLMEWTYDSDTAPRLLYLKPRPMSAYKFQSNGLEQGQMNDDSVDVICIQSNHQLPSNFEIDYDRMFEKVFQSKFEPIIEMMGKHWNTIFEGATTLEQWFEK